MGMAFGSPKKVECEGGLGDESRPMSEWEGRVDGGETSDEMVLESTDRAFGFVGAMNVWGSELDGDVRAMEGGDEVGRDFVIKNVERREKTAEREEGMEV